MILRPGEIEASIESVPVDGFARVEGALNPASLLEEANFSETIHKPGWAGEESWGGSFAGHEDLPAGMQGAGQLFTDLGRLAQRAGYQDWQTNRFMFKATTEGYPWHPDRPSFRHFVFLAYLLGRTQMFVQTRNGRPYGMVLNAGDILILQAATNADDDTTATWHGAQPSGLRAFLGVVYETTAPSVYDLPSHGQVGGDVERVGVGGGLAA